MTTAYTQPDYERDRRYISNHNSVGTGNVLGQLETLMFGNVIGIGSESLYVGHAGLSSRFLAMSTVHRLLEHNVVLDNMIKRRHGKTQSAPMKDEELKQTREECLGTISRRIGELFEQRYRGAVRRLEAYDRRLRDPKVQLKELGTALSAGNPDAVYELAERFAIMTEHLNDDDPLVKKYSKLISAGK